MDSIRSLAGLLNQDCACFSLDVDALKQALHADSVLAGWWPHWQDTHAHLFSNNGLFTLPIGATLRVGAAQTRGDYEGTFTLTAVYQ